MTRIKFYALLKDFFFRLALLIISVNKKRVLISYDLHYLSTVHTFTTFGLLIETW